MSNCDDKRMSHMMTKYTFLGQDQIPIITFSEKLIRACKSINNDDEESM